LSRETILKDQNYEKAVELLRQAADGELFGALADEIEEMVAAEHFGVTDIERYMHLLSFLAGEPAELLLSLEDRRVLRTVGGEAATLRDVNASHRRDGWIFVATERSKVTDMLTDQGTRVLLGRHPSHHELGGEDAEWQLYQPVRSVLLSYLVARERRTLVGRLEERFAINLRALVNSPGSFLNYDPQARFASQVADPHDVYMAVTIDKKLPAADRDLVANAEAVLEYVGAAYKKLTTCKLDAGVADPPLFVVGRREAALMARPPRGVAQDDGKLVAAINREHPQYRSLLSVFRERPELASYCLAKDLLLTEDRLLNLDMALISAIRHRRSRLRGVDGV
jgi:hypothetical protein